jgi:hypothetical protein
MNSDLNKTGSRGADSLPPKGNWEVNWGHVQGPAPMLVYKED